MNYRLATRGDAHALASIAHGCGPELSDCFTLQLGIRFQRRYYEAVLREPTTIAVVAENGAGRVVGFALGTTDSERLVGAVGNAAAPLAAAALWGVASQPRLVGGLVKRSLSLFGRGKGGDYLVGHGAKVSFLAVARDERSIQAGPRLMKRVIAELREAGARRIAAEVDASNPRVIRLHQRLGAAVVREFTTPSRIDRVILEYPEGSSNRVAVAA